MTKKQQVINRIVGKLSERIGLAIAMAGAGCSNEHSTQESETTPEKIAILLQKELGDIPDDWMSQEW